MADLSNYENEVENAKPMTSYDPIPAGTYTAVITESEIKDTSNNTGQQLALRWQIIEGEHEGRFVFDRITLKNQNPQAVEIGMRQLKSIALAVGHAGRLGDSAELHGQPCLIKVKVAPPRTDTKTGKTYDTSNEIKGYDPLDGTAPVATQQAASVASASSRATTTAPARVTPATPVAKPWQRNKAS